MDKRTNEYKKMVANEKSKGLGDTIEKITEATGIKALVHSLFGDDCGCDERKKRLNKIFKYKAECLTEVEYNTLVDVLPKSKSTITPENQTKLLKIYQRVINPKQGHTSCTACWRRITEQLTQLTSEYTKEMGNG